MVVGMHMRLLVLIFTTRGVTVDAPSICWHWWCGSAGRCHGRSCPHLGPASHIAPHVASACCALLPSQPPGHLVPCRQ